MLKKSYCFCLCSILLIGLFSCSKSEVLSSSEKQWLKQRNDSIVAAVFPYYPPYQFVNNDNKIDGILVDYLHLIEDKIGHKFQEKLYTDWSKLMDDARNKKIDIILEIQETPSRKKYLNFYSQLIESEHLLITRKDAQYGSKISDFYNKTIILPKEYAIAELVKQKYPKLNLVYAEDDLSSLQKLNSGEYEGYIGPKAVINYFIKTNNLNNLKIASETGLYYKPGIAVTKDNIVLNKIISKATSNISEKEKQTILDNWIFGIVTPFYYKTSFWVSLSGTVLVLLIIILLINRYLKFIIKKKTKELRIAKELAEESNRLNMTFIHNISHEIRTPMNGIIGFSELLNDPKLTPEEQEQYAKIVMDSSKQLTNIIGDITEISKLQTNQVAVHEEKTDLNVILETLFSKFQDKARDKDITINFANELIHPNNIVQIDKPKIYKILSNLIDNAIKFTNEGIVKISCRLKDGQLLFSIKDTGIGIKQKDQELIFRNFSQSDKDATKIYDGLGLGLSISRKNARLLGGDISFTSVLNEGSTFVLSVPHHAISN